MIRGSAWSFLALAIFSLAGCKQENPYGKHDPGKVEPAMIIGQDPAKFDCTKVITLAEAQTVAGVPLQVHEETMTPEPGTPRACGYQGSGPRAGDAGIPYWRVAFDCRARGIHDAEEAMAMYIAESDSDAGAWSAFAREIPGIGKRALEHGNIRIIAIDTDTPCAIYVVGPDATTREALTKLVIGKLDQTNQPTPPRAVKK